MYTIHAHDIHVALASGIDWLEVAGVQETSRNGAVLASPVPVCTAYARPECRVLRSATRDANPFFHVVESAWMLAGRNDLALLKQYVSTFGAYSDDGVTIPDAYGYRWRRHFGFDQLPMLISELRQHPDSRRCVLQMWDARVDLERMLAGGKAVPCNTQAYFAIRKGKLEMTVCNRSNDAILGAYGANAVHFGFLQEYVAAHLRVGVGTYYQISNNLHIYSDVHPKEKRERMAPELFARREEPSLLMEWDTDGLDWDLGVFEHTDYLPSPRSRWFAALVCPVQRVWNARKAGASVEEQLSRCTEIGPADWRAACTEWIERRVK